MSDTPIDPDWEKLIDDVNARIAALRSCWKATEADTPELHQKIAHDIYLPAVWLLAEFCAAVEIELDNDDA